MIDLYQFPPSTSPQMLLRQFIQEIEKIVGSLQKHLDDLREGLDKPDIISELIQAVNSLIQLQDSTKNYLNEYKANFLGERDKSKSSVEILEAFIHESRHPISSIQGWVGVIQSNNKPDLETSIFEGFNIALLTLKSMCEKMKTLQK
jgi:Zn-finger domain-containing protein